MKELNIMDNKNVWKTLEVEDITIGRGTSCAREFFKRDKRTVPSRSIP
jgi:hypothetical protein